MDEVLPGVYHWTAVHPRIQFVVSSYWLDGHGVLVDPLVPDGAGTEWFAERPVTPTAIVLSNRHHYRDSARFAVPVWCPAAGLHEFTDGEDVRGFDPADELPGGLVAKEIGGLCPDENALHLPAAGALFIADGVVRGPAEGAAIGFVPDHLMDDPAQTKRQLLDAYRRVLAETEFEHLLLAHGGPVIGDGRAQLAEFVQTGGRTADGL